MLTRVYTSGYTLCIPPCVYPWVYTSLCIPLGVYIPMCTTVGVHSYVYTGGCTSLCVPRGIPPCVYLGMPPCVREITMRKEDLFLRGEKKRTLRKEDLLLREERDHEVHSAPLSSSPVSLLVDIPALLFSSRFTVGGCS